MSFALKSTLALATFAALGLASAHPAQATTYDFTSLDVPGGYATTAYGINNSGEVVGTYQDSSSGYHGFTYTAQTGYTTFNVPGAAAGTTQAFGVNNAGQIVGNSSGYGFIYTPGIGYAQFNGPADDGGPNNISALRGINDSSTVVGTYTSPNRGEEGFIYSTGTGFTMFDKYQVDGINDAGQVVGENSNTAQGFLYTPGAGFTPLYVGPANGLNNAGQIVGSDGPGGYIYTPGSGYAEFMAPFTVDHVDYVLDTAAESINDLGQVVGYYDDSTGRHSFLATPSPAPEPSQWAALGFAAFGALGLLLRARTRTRP